MKDKEQNKTLIYSVHTIKTCFFFKFYHFGKFRVINRLFWPSFLRVGFGSHSINVFLSDQSSRNNEMSVIDRGEKFSIPIADC